VEVYGDGEEKNSNNGAVNNVISTVFMAAVAVVAVVTS
jgi:hypothetical protein